MKKQSDHELVILAIIAKFGPCTPYQVRQHFEGSSNAFFSGSTGAVYPAIRRLHGSELVAKRDDLRGKQPRSLYTITESGMTAVSSWLAPPFTGDALSVPHDPLRIRMYFLESLPPADRAPAVAEMIGALEKQLPDRKAFAKSFQNPKTKRLSQLAGLGALYLARAQLRWLREVHAELLEDAGAPQIKAPTNQ